MKVILVSNYFNHHQQPLSDALYSFTGGQFAFIATAKIPEERIRLGYGGEPIPDYVLYAYENREQYCRCVELIAGADVVIAGSAPQKMLYKRIRTGKLLFRYSERPLKNGPEWEKYLLRLLRWRYWNPRGKPIYLLSAGAYAAGEYAAFGLFRGRAYRWGYFTETKRYSSGELFAKKSPGKLLWAGRLLSWKHPDQVVEVARRLKEDGYEFELTILGIGPMEDLLRERIRLYCLENTVHLAGAMPPRKVREHMDQAGIFLFTSDRQEGWGAVLNEAMNSGCAVVTSHAVGSAPFLIRDGENGFLYESGNTAMLYEKTKYLLDHPLEQNRLGQAACDTITEEWNAETAAERLLQLTERILAGEKSPELYPSGPCSRARLLYDNWSENCQREMTGCY